MEAPRRAWPVLRVLRVLPVLPALPALLALLLLLAGPAAALERPYCRNGTACIENGSNSSKDYFFKVNGRTLNVFYNESARVFSVTCDAGDDDEPGPVAAADERALPALRDLATVDFAEFQGCRPPAGSYAAALRALNVIVTVKLWVLRLPASPRLARAQLAGLPGLQELKLSAPLRPAPPLRPPPDFLAELPGLRTLRLYRVEAARALPQLPAALEWLELSEAGLPAAEREPAPAAREPAPAAPHWLARLRALRRLTLSEQYSGGRLAPPPLAALKNLTEASLHAPLGPLPARWLAGSSLRKLYLVSCGISDLSGLPFAGTNLTVLNVSHNNLTDLPRGVFESLAALEVLDVSSNKLTRSGLERALPPLGALRELRASGNPLGSLCGSASIARGRESSELPRTLHRLELRKTRATRLCTDWLQETPDLAVIDLQQNLIDSLDYDELVMKRSAASAAAGVALLLQDNPLRELAVTRDQVQACQTVADATRARVELGLSALHCSCRGGLLRALLRNCSRLLALPDDVPCTNDTRTFLHYDPDQMLCDYEHSCLPGCTCGAWRLRDNATVVTCAAGASRASRAGGDGWARWPGWAAASRARPLALLAPAAGLQEVPPAQLVELRAPHNSITALDANDIPDTLQELDLRNNSIARVSAAAAARLRGVRRVRLAGNPFACVCAERHALATLGDANVSDWKELRCGGAGPLRGRLLSGVRPDELCDGTLAWALGGAGGVAAVVLLAGAAVALWRYGQPHLKRFLFERQLCLDWVLGVDDEVDDPAKTHDAFVSYAHQDHARAALLVRGLEARGYSTVEHCRDWLPGAAVAEHIARSVLCARRTLLLVSDDYGASKWALEEFRAAHAHALRARSARVLLLRCGLRAPERLPPDLQLHLQYNTYLDVDDPAFWLKLCRAMPPPRAAPAEPPPELQQPRPGELPRLGTPPAPLAGKPPRVLTPPAPRALQAEAAERLRRLLSPSPAPALAAPPAPAPALAAPPAPAPAPALAAPPAPAPALAAPPAPAPAPALAAPPAPAPALAAPPAPAPALAAPPAPAPAPALAAPPAPAPALAAPPAPAPALAAPPAPAPALAAPPAPAPAPALAAPPAPAPALAAPPAPAPAPALAAPPAPAPAPALAAPPAPAPALAAPPAPAPALAAPPAPAPAVQKHSLAAQLELAPRAAPAC